MRERIAKSLVVDKFIKYQNGNLVNDFADMTKHIDFSRKYESKVLSKLNLSNDADKAFYKKVISAFENFIQFLSDDDVIIDHTYLWDIVSMPKIGRAHV